MDKQNSDNLENKVLQCPQCESEVPLQPRPETGIWTCAECSHEFRPATSDLKEKVKEVASSRGFSFFSLFFLLFTMSTVLGTLTWGLPSVVTGQDLTLSELPCLSQCIFSLAEFVAASACQVWTISIFAAVVTWFFVVRFLKGWFRFLFNLGVLLMYLAIMSAVFLAIILSYFPYNAGCTM